MISAGVEHVYDGISGVCQGHWEVFWCPINVEHISTAVRRGHLYLLVSVAQKGRQGCKVNPGRSGAGGVYTPIMTPRSRRHGDRPTCTRTPTRRTSGALRPRECSSPEEFLPGHPLTSQRGKQMSPLHARLHSSDIQISCCRSKLADSCRLCWRRQTTSSNTQI